MCVCVCVCVCVLDGPHTQGMEQKREVGVLARENTPPSAVRRTHSNTQSDMRAHMLTLATWHYLHAHISHMALLACSH